MTTMITVIGTRTIYGRSRQTGNRLNGTIVDYRYDDMDTQEKLTGSVFVGDKCCMGCNIHVFSDYLLEREDGKTYATKFTPLGTRSYFDSYK